jgi:hypothetical protein
LELVDIDEEVAAPAKEMSTRLNAASPIVGDNKPPRSDELSSPKYPLARFRKSIKFFQ